MTEYIMNVPDEAAEYFIAKFGLDDVTMLGYHLAGEIVRCMDCVFCMAYMAGTYCDYMAHSVEPDGFCSWAERKVD